MENYVSPALIVKRCDVQCVFIFRSEVYLNIHLIFACYQLPEGLDVSYGSI